MLECVKVKFIPHFISKLNLHKQVLLNESYNSSICENVEIINDEKGETNDSPMDIGETSNLSSAFGVSLLDKNDSINENPTNNISTKGKEKNE